jgi:hypothetical protein
LLLCSLAWSNPWPSRSQLDKTYSVIQGVYGRLIACASMRLRIQRLQRTDGVTRLETSCERYLWLYQISRKCLVARQKGVDYQPEMDFGYSDANKQSETLTCSRRTARSGSCRSGPDPRLPGRFHLTLRLDSCPCCNCSRLWQPRSCRRCACHGRRQS